jgi:hypothetical protein
VQGINGNMYVTYAPDGRTAQVAATSGQGAVAIFNESGVLQQTIVGGPLAAPWGQRRVARLVATAQGRSLIVGIKQQTCNAARFTAWRFS